MEGVKLPGTGQIIMATGPVCAGKNSHMDYLTGLLGIPHIIVSAELDAQFGKAVASDRRNGKLVNDSRVHLALKQRLTTPECCTARLVVINGGPRSVVQATWARGRDIAIFFHVDLDVVLERSQNRRECPTCLKSYNLKKLQSTRCPRCRGGLIVREDDKPDKVLYRFCNDMEWLYKVRKRASEICRVIDLDANTTELHVREQLRRKLSLAGIAIPAEEALKLPSQSPISDLAVATR